MPAEKIESPAGPITIDTPPPIAPSTILLAYLLDVRPGERVLELGCGSGYLAVVAKKLGAGRVMASDIAGHACRAATENARANGVEIDVRRGDFFDQLQGERFDFIIFNPPQTPAPGPIGPKYGGPYGTIHFETVLPKIAEHLRPGGRVLLHVISLVDPVRLLPLLEPFAVELRAESDRPFEAAEYEGYAPGLVAYLEERAAAGRAQLNKEGERWVFKNRFLRARPKRKETRLVVNADDMGFDQQRNEGAIQAFERGIVRSASLVANCTATEDAIARLQALAGSRFGPLDVGLHANLSEGHSLVGALSGLTTIDGEFVGPKKDVWQRLSSPEAPVDERGLGAELESQLASLTARGLEITHLDGHQHVHAFLRARASSLELARRRGIFLRIPDEPSLGMKVGSFAGEIATIAENGRALRPLAEGVFKVQFFRGLAARVAAGDPLTRFRASLEGLPAGATCELMVHPTTEPRKELDALCDPSWPDWLAERGIALTSFRDLLLVPGSL